MIKIGSRYVQSDPRQREYDRQWNENPPHWDGPVERAKLEKETKEERENEPSAKD